MFRRREVGGGSEADSSAALRNDKQKEQTEATAKYRDSGFARMTTRLCRREEGDMKLTAA